MNRIKYLFVLFFLFQYTSNLQAQEIHNLSENSLASQEKIIQQLDESLNLETCFYYDKIAANLSSQKDDDYLLENLTRQIWDETSSDWKNDSLYEFSYNNINLVDTFIVHKWSNGGGWGNKYKETYSYDTNDRISFSNEFYWEGYWRELYRYYYDYYGNGNLYHINEHTSTGTEWLYVAAYTYSYNTNSDTSMIVLSVLDLFHGWWIYSWKDEFNYDSTNLLIEKTHYDHYYLQVWLPEINDLYFYDNNDNKTENIRQVWNNTDSIWINDYRYLYEYDINNVLLSIIYQDWQSDSLNWKNVWREAYTYTPQNKIATMSKQTWTQETGWNNYVLRTYFYDTNYNWVERITFLWEETYWKNYYRHIATWMQPVSVWETSPYLETYYLYNNYPNPFNPSTKIKFQIPNTEFVSLKVYDVLGKEIATLVDEEKAAGKYEIQFNSHSGEIRNLPSGIYFYTLKAGQYSETKKMILLK